MLEFEKFQKHSDEDLITDRMLLSQYDLTDEQKNAIKFLRNELKDSLSDEDIPLWKYEEYLQKFNL